mgnify:CR=1 FL=1
MPWKDTNAMQERIQFISDWLKRIDTFSDLCARYDISRKSGYKWIDRYQKEGPDWVLDRSHAARVIANKTPLAVEGGTRTFLEDGDEVTLQLAGLERSEQFFLRVEDDGRRFDDVAVEPSSDDQRRVIALAFRLAGARRVMMRLFWRSER